MIVVFPISAFFFALTFIMYLTLPQLQSIQDKAVTYLSFWFMISYLVTALTHTLDVDFIYNKCQIFGKFAQILKDFTEFCNIIISNIILQKILYILVP